MTSAFSYFYLLTTHSSTWLSSTTHQEVKERYLAKLVAGEVYPSFAMTEPTIASSDPTAIETTATLSADGEWWTITGRKWWTSAASSAAWTSVMVRTDGGGGGGGGGGGHGNGDAAADLHGSFSILLVPTDAAGYNIVRSTEVLGNGIAWDHAEVSYDGVRVPASHLVGKRGAGFAIAQERLGPGRIFHCMRWVGQAQRAFDLMNARLQSRTVRGGGGSGSGSGSGPGGAGGGGSKQHVKLGSKQLMQQHVFDSYADVSAMRLLTLAAAEAMDADMARGATGGSGTVARLQLATAKAWGARALNRVLDRALQVWGAKGLTEDTPLSSMYRHARAARFYDGPDEVHVETVGKMIGRVYAAGDSWDFSESAARKGGAAPLRADDAEDHLGGAALPSKL